MNKSKVLFLLHIPPPVHGSSIVGKAIQNSGVINSSFDCQYINLLVSHKIDETGKTNLLKVFRFIAVWVTLLIEMVRKKPDLCYLALTATGTAFYKDVLLVILLRIFRIKRVYHLHNKGVSIWQDEWFDNMLYRFVFKNTDVILLSRYLYPDIQKYVPETRVYYCPNGIRKQQGNWKKVIGNREQQGNRQGKAVEILFLSNLIESKGVFVLLDACKILQGKKLRFHCTFVGDIGDVNEKWFKLRVEELGLHDCVHYAGKKYGREKEAIFANAEIFAFPTYNECFPLVLLEAMQFSLPIVSTFEGGIQDVVENGVTGFLVSQKDVEALAEKLEILIQNPDLRLRMGEAGRKRYEEKFTLEMFEDRMVEILNGVMNDELHKLTIDNENL